MPKIGVFLFTILIVFPPLVRAEVDEDFDSTVKELKSALKDDGPVRPPEPQSRAEVGAALLGGYLATGDGSGLVNGFDLHAGVDLYSSRWTTEFCYRNFGSQSIGGDSESLTQLDLVILYKSDLDRNLYLRAGGGISAADLRGDRRGDSFDDEAPNLVGLIGVEKLFSPRVGVGPDLDLHAPMGSTGDQRNFVDASVRLNFHF